jgi:hypothetical protein
MAGYPEEYYGPPIPDGCIEIEAYVPAGWFLDRNPWSMPSPEENIFWFGELCVEGNVAVLEFTELGNRTCRETPWGTRDDEPLCFSGWTMKLSQPDRHVMAWDPSFPVDWGFYIASVHFDDWLWRYDSLTVTTGGDMVFVEGVFEFVTPLWWVESNDFTRWKFLVRERAAPAFALHRSAIRRGR